MRPRTMEEWKTLINCVISAASSREILSGCHQLSPVGGARYLVTINFLSFDKHHSHLQKVGLEFIQIKLWKEKPKER